MANDPLIIGATSGAVICAAGYVVGRMHAAHQRGQRWPRISVNVDVEPGAKRRTLIRRRKTGTDPGDDRTPRE